MCILSVLPVLPVLPVFPVFPVFPVLPVLPVLPVVYTLYTPRSQEGGEPPKMATQIQTLISLPALATVLLGKVHNLK